MTVCIQAIQLCVVIHIMLCWQLAFLSVYLSLNLSFHCSVTHTCTATLQPVYRSACVSWHPQLTTEAFCCIKVVLSHAGGKQQIGLERWHQSSRLVPCTMLYNTVWIREMTPELLSVVLPPSVIQCSSHICEVLSRPKMPKLLMVETLMCYNETVS